MRVLHTGREGRIAAQGPLAERVPTLRGTLMAADERAHLGGVTTTLRTTMGLFLAWGG